MTAEKKAKKPALLSIEEAMNLGITKLRLPHWAHHDDHIEIVVIPDARSGKNYLGPWVTMHFPTSGPLIGGSPKKEVLISGVGNTADKAWLPYVEERLVS